MKTKLIFATLRSVCCSLFCISQNVGSFSLDQVLEKLQNAQTSGPQMLRNQVRINRIAEI
jgi:hypothetical protein